MSFKFEPVTSFSAKDHFLITTPPKPPKLGVFVRQRCAMFFFFGPQFLQSFVELVWSLVGVRPAVTSKKSVWRQRVPYAKLQRPETQFSTNARGSSR